MPPSQLANAHATTRPRVPPSRKRSCATRIAGLVLRCTASSLLGTAPVAAAAAAAARVGLPMPAAAGASRVVWLASTLFSALSCKVRLQAQLLVSAASVAFVAAIAAHDMLAQSAPPGMAAGALVCTAGAAAAHCFIVYVWDCHLRAAYLGRRAAPAPAPAAAVAAALRAKAKAKAA